MIGRSGQKEGMMSLQNLFKAIESFEFGARVGVASGFRTFGSINL